MYNVGIIGIGKMGISHCSILGTHPKVNKIYVCDSSKIVKSFFNKYSKNQVFTDYRNMLEVTDLEFVIVATPTKFHYKMVMDLLEHNCHVFCEKPLSLNSTESEQMMNLALEKNLSYYTSISGAWAAAHSMEYHNEKNLSIISLQELNKLEHIN